MKKILGCEMKMIWGGLCYGMHPRGIVEFRNLFPTTMHSQFIFLRPEKKRSIHELIEAKRNFGGGSNYVLTCKSMLRFMYSGERLIELLNSWFNSKFLSG